MSKELATKLVVVDQKAKDVAQLYDLILHADIDAHLAADAFAPVSAEAMSLLRAVRRPPSG